MRRFFGLSVVLSLAACGGGGGDSSSPVVMPPSANAPPQITSASAASIVENQLIALTVQATDGDGDQLSYTISGGEDSGVFTISSSGVLSFNNAPNFELPTDSDRDNVYLVTAGVSDGSGTTTVDITITVENDREGIAVRRVATGLNDITAIASVPTTDQLYITERGGNVYLFDANSEQLTLDRTILNVNTTGEGGLLGIAADPNDNNIYWTFVTAARTGIFATSGSNITIRRIRRNAIETPLGSGVILEIPHTTDINYGGAMGFDPIGDNLFIGVGDAGVPNNAQDQNTKLGKILRVLINPDPFAGVSPVYLLPAPNNPFQAGGGDPFIYGLGVQNPRDLAFDGRSLVFGDSGADAVEEINASIADNNGENFGWPFFEGSLAFQGMTSDLLTAPVTEYLQGTGDREGRLVRSGRVYPGPVTILQGDYIFADSDSGNIWGVSTNDLMTGNGLQSEQYELLNADFTPVNSSIGKVAAFAISSGGNLYFADANGDVFIVEPA